MALFRCGGGSGVTSAASVATNLPYTVTEDGLYVIAYGSWSSGDGDIKGYITIDSDALINIGCAGTVKSDNRRASGAIAIAKLKSGQTISAKEKNCTENWYQVIKIE